FAIGVVLVLLVAVITTGQAYPGALALVVALIFGAALAYGIALTIFIEEFLLGVVDLIKLLEGDVKAVAHITATVSEREVGEVTHGLRRLIGLPVAARPTPPVPTLPSLPRYPAPPARPAPRTDATARDTAFAGATALAATAATSAATSAARPPQAAVATEPVTEPPTSPPPPTGEPVRADRLPRIGWTYEHEAIRPTRPAPLPDTLAELAGAAAIAGVGSLFQQHVASATSEPSTADEPTVAAAAAPEQPTDPAPLDVAVVSAPLDTPDAASATSATSEEDAPPLDDERLAEPVALALPDEDTATPVSDERTPLDAETPPLDPIMLSHAPATTPLAQEAEPVDAEPVMAEMLAPAPPTTPLRPVDAPLDPAMLAPAPATTPLAAQVEPQEAEPVSTPVEPAPAEERAPDVSEAEPAGTASEAAPIAPVAATDVAEAAESAPSDAPDAADVPVRSAFSRVTRPVAGLETALDAINRVSPNSGPRASAPESGLWERLSQALITRTGAPSGPFAAPHAHPASSDMPDTSATSEASEADETPQA
ncbi:MAG TPA: hypothetical protein VIC27_12335, partial [Ktedonobacterales bacterium]